MTEERGIYAHHDCTGTRYQTSNGDGDGITYDFSHLQPVTMGAFPTPYISSSNSPQISVSGYAGNNHPIATPVSVPQALPMHPNVTLSDRHLMAPDHNFRPNMLPPNMSGSSPLFAPSPPSFATQKSPIQEAQMIPKPNTVATTSMAPANAFDITSSSNRGTTCKEGQSIPEEQWTRPSVQPSSSRWQQARDYRRQVYEPPYLDPHTDESIASVEANAEFWVHLLIRAILNTTDVKDTATSHHLRLFSSSHIDPVLIEACSREIFTTLIDRCKNGFRGPPAFNKALKASHQLEPDRTATCEERMRCVIKVLSWNKRACKDVMYEDWKIKLLVNHPLSYDKEKDSQKGSNDQRRRRQLAAQERMERTEEELRAYREARREAVGESTGGAQYTDVGSAWEKSVPSEWHFHKADGSLKFQEFGSLTGKRPIGESRGGDAKRQHL